MSKWRNKRRQNKRSSSWIYLLAGIVFAISYILYPHLNRPYSKRQSPAPPTVDRGQNDRARDTFTPQTIIGRVISVADGDTVVVLDATNQQRRIRLAGIDAPEHGQAHANAAKQALRQLCLQQRVTVDVTDVDRYGRYVGRIVVDQKSVNRQLIRLGLAWHYSQYDDQPELATLQQEAKSQRLGLWADEKPIAPWDWRRAQQ